MGSNGIANGLFMVVPNCYGTEGLIDLYEIFISSTPTGRILAQAPRATLETAAPVADLDLAQWQDWSSTSSCSSRPADRHFYAGVLVEPVRAEHRRSE